MTTDPAVSVVMAAAKASTVLPASLEAIKRQNYPHHIEIVVAAADRESAESASRAGVVVVNNKSGRTATGLNLAVAASSGEIIIRVDAHSEIPQDYVSSIVTVLKETGADNVGGMQVPAGTTYWEKSIAAAMSSKIGAGYARYRVGGQAGPAETVYLGAFWSSTLERLGGFNEAFVRHQDYELNQRIRDSGGTVWFDPSIRVRYRPRSSLPALARQYFEFGQWKREFSRAYPGSLKPRQWAPPGLVIVLAFSFVVATFWPAFLIVPAAYTVAIIGAGLAMLPRVGAPAFGIPFALSAMHLSWGLGFLVGQTND